MMKEKNWSVCKLFTLGKGKFEGAGWTGNFQTSYKKAEPMGYLAAIQTPDGIIHFISSRLHYRFNLEWIETPNAAQEHQNNDK